MPPPAPPLCHLHPHLHPIRKLTVTAWAVPPAGLQAQCWAGQGAHSLEQHASPGQPLPAVKPPFGSLLPAASYAQSLLPAPGPPQLPCPALPQKLHWWSTGRSREACLLELSRTFPLQPVAAAEVAAPQSAASPARLLRGARHWLLPAAVQAGERCCTCCTRQPAGHT